MKRISALALAMGLMVGCEKAADEPAPTNTTATPSPEDMMKKMQGGMDATAKAVGDAAATTGDAVKDAAATTGDAVKDAAAATGDAVKDAADATGDAVKDATDAVSPKP